MKDIFKKYKKKKKVSNIWVVVTSLVLAIGVNFFVLEWSDFWNSMKANILEVKMQNEQSDIYWVLNNNYIDIFSNQNMDDVKNISMSLSYNPNNVGIFIVEDNTSDVLMLSDDKWIQSVLINYSPEKDILAWDKLFSVETSKLNQTSEQLNIINANFRDNQGENYLLSTSGITF